MDECRNPDCGNIDHLRRQLKAALGQASRLRGLLGRMPPVHHHGVGCDPGRCAACALQDEVNAAVEPAPSEAVPTLLCGWCRAPIAGADTYEGGKAFHVYVGDCYAAHGRNPPPEFPWRSEPTQGSQRPGHDIFNAEHLLREEWWFGLGCEPTRLYGDDGEMQCGACVVDFRRMPIEELRAWVERHRAAELTRKFAAARLTPDSKKG